MKYLPVFSVGIEMNQKLDFQKIDHYLTYRQLTEKLLFGSSLLMLFEATDLLPFASLFLIGFSQMMPCHASQCTLARKELLCLLNWGAQVSL